jgi:hypothetical protein
MKVKLTWLYYAVCSSWQAANFLSFVLRRTCNRHLCKAIYSQLHICIDYNLQPINAGFVISKYGNLFLRERINSLVSEPEGSIVTNTTAHKEWGQHLTSLISVIWGKQWKTSQGRNRLEFILGLLNTCHTSFEAICPLIIPGWKKFSLLNDT